MNSNLTSTLVALMVGLFTPCSVFADEQEPGAIPKPAGYWPLDGDTKDAVGRHHGTLNNAKLVDDAQIGSHSVKLGSRAVNRSIMFGSFDPSDGDLTISLWIKPDPSGNGHQILMAKRQAWAKDQLRWQFVWQDIHPKKKPIPGEPYALTKEVIRFESWSDPDSRAEFDCAIKPNVWTHLVLTHAGEDGRTKLFINGKEVEGKPQSMNFGPAKDAPVVIGGTHPKDWREIYNGQIDDVKLWDEVLTPKQVASLYEQVNSDWPQWLGLHRDAIWRETNIIKAFPVDGPELRWSTKIGNGFSGPAVAGGRVFILDRVSADKVAPKDMGAYTRKSIAGKERIVCLQESTGELLWKYEYDCPYTIATNYANGPRATPTISDSRVYALGAEGHLSCLNVKDGSVIWSHDFKSEYGLKVPIWGIASHPLIDGDKLICVAGGTSGVAVAFNKKTGKELWRSLPAKEPGYAPPVIYEIEGERQLLIWHSDAICAVDPETGKPFWSVKINPFGAMAIAMPRLVGRDLFLMGHRRQSWMLRIAPDRRSAEIVWQGNTKIGIGGVHNTPFIENGLIFGCDLDGRFTCAKLSDGEQLWTTFEPHQAKRPVSWGNVFTLKHEDRFFLATDTGDLIIARLDADGYHETSRAHLIEPNQAIGNRKLVWSHPAFANGNIYLRNDGEIRCFSLRETRE